jgi:hypothetical protein
MAGGAMIGASMEWAHEGQEWGHIYGSIHVRRKNYISPRRHVHGSPYLIPSASSVAAVILKHRIYLPKTILLLYRLVSRASYGSSYGS